MNSNLPSELKVRFKKYKKLFIWKVSINAKKESYSLVRSNKFVTAVGKGPTIETA